MKNKVIISNVANLPTEYGNFKIVCFKEKIKFNYYKEHLVAFTEKLGNIPLVRIHSECLTGDAFGSLKCDCGPELHKSLKEISEHPDGGILIYLRQEGRDIGLFNKVNAYNLQDKGRDTVEANVELGLKADARKYDIVKNIFDYFNLKEVELLTNNPEKISFAEKYVKVARKKILTGLNECNKDYLETKKNKMGHLI